MFVGQLPHHGKLIVTRYEDGCAIFRVLNEDLAKLELGQNDWSGRHGKKHPDPWLGYQWQ